LWIFRGGDMRTESADYQRNKVNVNSLIDKIRVEEKRKKRNVKIVFGVLITSITVTGIISSL
tara:strand:+ start:273 stop:458 length:186 start_codon:yes stop_codon:yes gene_type:complete